MESHSRVHMCKTIYMRERVRERERLREREAIAIIRGKIIIWLVKDGGKGTQFLAGKKAQENNIDALVQTGMSQCTSQN